MAVIRNNKLFVLNHYPDATVRKVQEGTKRDIQHRLTYDKKSWDNFKTITAKTESECYKLLRAEIEAK